MTYTVEDLRERAKMIREALPKGESISPLAVTAEMLEWAADALAAQQDGAWLGIGRSGVIEECAKVADRIAAINGEIVEKATQDGPSSEGLRFAASGENARRIAASIRALEQNRRD